MNFPAYGKLSQATKDLSNASKITARRECAAALKQLLSDSNLRNKLSKEASVAARDQNKSHHVVLSKIYSNAIKAAIHAAQVTLNSSTTTTKNEDVVLPFKIFSLVEKDSEAALASVKRKRQNGFDECEPFTFEHFERNRGTNQNLTLVQPKEIRELLKYCLDCLLENEDVYDLAEADLLNMLQKLCSRPDYVAHFHPVHDISDILTAVQDRLLQRSNSLSGTCLTNAAKAFFYLVHQYATVLDVDISGFVHPCLALVMDWVRHCTSSREGAGLGAGSTLKWMYGVVVDILSAYPDQCIVELERDDFGKEFFGYARRCWWQAVDETKQVLVAYFSAHLYVCEVAGNQQGLFPGDLGSIGTASIDKKKLGYLEDMLFSEKNLEAYSNMSNSQSMDLNRTTDRNRMDRRATKKRRKTGAGAVQERFCPLGRSQRKYLELCARLLRCLQRQHLATSERSSADSVDALLVEECVNKPSSGLGSHQLVDEIGLLSSSPWVSCIAASSFGHVVSSEMKEMTPSMDFTSQSPPDCASIPLSQAESESGIGSENGELHLKLPMLLAIDGDANELDDSKIIAYLQIISACAEAFPRGECWASTNKWYKTTFSPLQLGDVVTYSTACSPLDMAAIVYSLSLILSRYGGANANVQVQMWALLCLLKLTESSHISCKYSQGNGSSHELTLAWQHVWKRLLQPELRYNSSTAQAESSSIGEMVLMLLTEIVRGGLVELGSFDDLAGAKHASFIRKHQGKIWNLPIFSSAVELKISAPFELASMVIARSGLVESDGDSIGSRGADPNIQLMMKAEAEKGRGRSFRLANFCLQFISQAAKIGEVEKIRRVGMFCSAVFCALLDTKVTNLTSFTMKSFRELKVTDHSHHPSCLYLPEEIIGINTIAVDLSLLWEDSIVPFWFQDAIDFDRTLWNKHRDIPLCPFWSYSDRSWLATQLSNCRSFKTSRPVQAVTDLKEYCLKNLSNILYLGGAGDNAALKALPIPLSCKTSVTKTILAIALCGDDAQRANASWNPVEHCIDSIVNESITGMNHFRHLEFAFVFTDLIGIIRLVRSVMSIEPCAKYVKGVLPPTLCTRLYKACKKVIHQHGKGQLSSIMNSNKKSASKTHSPKDVDSDFDAIETDEHEVHPQSSRLSTLSRSSESELDKFDSEEDTRTKRKRKKVHTSRDYSRRSSHGREGINGGGGHRVFDDCLSFWICSSILIHLDPSLQSGSFIAESILWPQDINEGDTSAFDSDEPLDCILLLGLLHYFVSSDRQYKTNGVIGAGSTMMLCLDIVVQCREISGIASPMHMWGFGICHPLISQLRCDKSSKISKDEIEKLISVLQPEDKGALRALQNRPHLWASQVHAATLCFTNEDLDFHLAFDDIFSKSFVMKPLGSQHPSVRRAGLQALAAALTFFPNIQERIANTAIAKFPPKPAFNSTHDKETFKQWLEGKTKNADFVDLRKRSWVGNKLALEMDKITCLGTVAQNTSSEELAVEMVCTLIMISEFSKHRRQVFRMLEDIAQQRNFGTISELLENAQTLFFRNWITEERSLFLLPIIVTSPSVVRASVRLQVIDSYNPPDEKEKSSGLSCTSTVSETAAAEYILQNAAFIVPFILITNMDLREEVRDLLSSSVEQTSEIAEGKSYFWNLVSEVAVACTDGDVKTMLKSHFFNIYSHLIPLFLLDSDSESARNVRRYAEEFLNSISSSLKIVQKQMKNSTALIALELLRVEMKKEFFYIHDNKFPTQFLARALEHVAKTTNVSTGRVSNGESVFFTNSISAAECILHLRSILDDTKHPACRLNVWDAIDATIEIVQSGVPGTNEIGFSVVSILNICLNYKDQFDIRCGALRRLQSIFVDDAKNKSEVNRYVNKIVSCLIQIHEEYQVGLVELFQVCRNSKRTRDRLSSSLIITGEDDQTPLQDSLFLYEDDGYDLISSVDQQSDKSKLSSIIECMSQTYDILDLILDTGPNATLTEEVQQSLDPFPESTLTQAETEVLETFNKKCCLRSLKQQFNLDREQRSDLDFSKHVERFLTVASRFRFSESNNMAKSSYNGGHTILPPDVRSFISALKNLNQEIQTHEAQKKTAEEYSYECSYTKLGEELFEFCDGKYLEEIQVASIQCIGSLGLLSQSTDLKAKPSSTRELSTSDPLTDIYISAFALLTERIQSQDVKIAIDAKDTIKALMCTEDGLNSWRNMDKKLQYHAILAPFDNGSITQRYTRGELSDTYLEKVLLRVNKTMDEIKSDSSWCWNDELWLIRDNISYKEWISNLVCAIIKCCYGEYDSGCDSASRSINGSSDFFPACIFMCSRDPQFAAIIFPGIIYDLLDTDSNTNYDGSPDKLERKYMIGAPFSLTNQTLTRCFETILDTKDFPKTKHGDIRPKKSDQNNTQAIHICVETLNMLRLVTEREFSKSKPQKSRSTIKGRKYVKGHAVNVTEEEYNGALPEPILWRGRPYGIVLHLKGTDLSHAYLKTKDYAAALYYAELFADNRLGGSGCIFERLSTVKVAQSSLSGFGIPIENCRELSQADLAVDFHHVLELCFSELHEDEVLAGLEEQTSSIRFEKPECFHDHSPQFDRIESTGSIISGLTGLDTKTQLHVRSCASSDRFVVSAGLKQLGLRDVSFHYLAGAHARGAFRSTEDQKKLEDQWAEESWRLLQWDESLFKQTMQKSQESHGINFSPLTISNTKPGFHSSFRTLIASLLEEDFLTFRINIRNTRSSLLGEFRQHVGQNAPIVELNSYSLKSSSINQLEDLCEVFKGGDTSASSWMAKHCPTMNFVAKTHKEAKFSDLECSMVAHEVFLKLLHKKFGENSDDLIGRNISSHLWTFCKVARERERPDIALSALDRLRHFTKMNGSQLESDELKSSLLSLKHGFEEAKILQCDGNTAAAIRACKEIIMRLNKWQSKQVQHYVLLTEARLQCAQWLIDYPIDSNSTTLNELLKPAASLAKKLREKNYVDSSLVSSTNFALGNFAADLYEGIQKRINSHEWKVLGQAAVGRQQQKEELQSYIDERKADVQANGVDEAYKKAYHNLKALDKEVEMDTQERKQVERSVVLYLDHALVAFGTALSHCSRSTSTSSEVVFRFVSLWFKNSNVKEDNIHEKIMEMLAGIPSHHFVPLIYQIFSRIDTASDLDNKFGYSFQAVLQNLVCKICIDHPYHGLIQLIALSNGTNVGQSKHANQFAGDEKKVQVIKQLIDRLKKTSTGYVSELLDSYKIVTDAYIALAMHPTKDWVKSRMTKNLQYTKTQLKARSLWLNKCLHRQTLSLPCVFTLPPQIRPGADYGDGDCDPIGSERIKSFADTFSITDSGIHRPKIVVCEGTKGGSYKQLVKGEDDIRQDAVMQQVFSTMNMFLRDQKNQSQVDRKLRLITYSCVPLSPASGVLEWVENTIPLAIYLINSKGAHSRYYPGEWSNNMCHMHMFCSPKKLQRQSYNEVCKNFSPAFRFFFMEKFSHSPQLWHKARMSYTRSCAANCMVGHILGIGDRHSNNILIQEHTGEIVHIDFGIVFEQGKVLNTPETVPFRLTRDVVDGMGPTGTDGVFTSAARSMTKVLRQNSSALLTVLSAVVSDPLYSWNIDLTNKQRNPEETSEADDYHKNALENHSLNIVESDNDAATRAIGRINEKLKGYEEGTFGQQQTIEGQVRFLIKEAKDPNNLSKLYPGWGAWI